MAKPQATGMSTPQMPIPAMNRYSTASTKTAVNAAATVNPAHHHSSRPRGRSTGPATASSMLAKSWPGSMTGAGSIAAISALGDRRVAVGQPRRIGRARPGVELFEQRVVERAGLAPAYLAVRVVKVAEDDRFGRAGLLAGGPDLAVGDRAVVAVGGDLRLADALQAVGAFLHHPAAAHGDLGVPGDRRPRVMPRIGEEVEAADLVGAVVRAEPGADAAVVDHRVDPVGIVHRRADRADHLARHARHRLEQDAGAIRRLLPIAVVADPVHRPPARDLFAADHRDVVLGLA